MMIKELFIKTIGYFAYKIESLSTAYKIEKNKKLLGEGGKRVIAEPNIINGIGNIIMEAPVSIGPGATIYEAGAKLIIKKPVITGPNLTVITGGHKYIAGR